MSVSQKSQYALRALFELAKSRDDGPIAVADIADAQAIPRRFLELILAQLRRVGFVASHRGVQGGYTLAVSPGAISVADILRALDGSLAPVKCIATESPTHCRLKGECVFADLWKRARDAVAKVYETTTLQDLLEKERRPAVGFAPEYAL
jgi:Rrf2 family transcriptional regulator, cysteine metabolism repressor